jgi:hypothetical protein
MVKRRDGEVPSGVPLTDVMALFPGCELVERQDLHSRLLRRLARHPMAAAISGIRVIPRTNTLLLLKAPR